jgi:hypothetical protein
MQMTPLLPKLLCAALIAFVVKCDQAPTPPADVAATNVVREKLGLRKVMPTWRFAGSEFSEDRWTDVTPPIGKHECKRLHRDSDLSIEWEEDYYYSGHTWIDSNDDGTLFESGTFAFSYAGDNAAIRKRVDSLQSTSDGHVGADNDQTLKEVDAVLSTWKISRL